MAVVPSLQIVDTDMSFDLSITGDVIYDVVEARQEFHNKLNKQITDICLKMMADLFGDIHDHIIVEQKFFNKVRLRRIKSPPVLYLNLDVGLGRQLHIKTILRGSVKLP